MATVYITQETSHDFRGAEEFGSELVFLCDGRDDFHNITNSQHNERLIAHLRQKLRDYVPGKDFILPVGSPYVQAVVFKIIGEFKIDKINLLRWDNRDFCYIPLCLRT